MLQMKLIEPVQMEWASPIVLDPKKNGSLRSFVAYRKLNPGTVRDSYPIPCMEECIESLVEERWFSTLNANAGYWQWEIDLKDWDKTAFT